MFITFIVCFITRFSDLVAIISGLRFQNLFDCMYMWHVTFLEYSYWRWFAVLLCFNCIFKFYRCSNHWISFRPHFIFILLQFWELDSNWPWSLRRRNASCLCSSPSSIRYFRSASNLVGLYLCFIIDVIVGIYRGHGVQPLNFNESS